MNTSYIIILGRQPMLGFAELERSFGAPSVRQIHDDVALLQTDQPVDINALGGSVKIAELVSQTASNGWLGVSKQAVRWLEQSLAGTSGKVTLGISAHGFDVTARDVQKTGLIIKSHLKNRDGSVRLVPNEAAALSSAQSYHNKFGTSPLKRELILVASPDGHGYIGELQSVQDIDAYTLRDRGRPKRDALNGMLPPKLAQTMINLAAGKQSDGRLLDPFCGTGVILMEAALMHYVVYGSDVNERMIGYSRDNLNWLKDRFRLSFDWYLHPADATTAQWQQPFTTIASETYLGEPMAQAPSLEKLEKVMAKCETVVRGFLLNLAAQTDPGFELCIAVPAWRIGDTITHLKVVDDLYSLGYNWIDFEHVDRSDLIYYRENQIVARELLVLTRG